MRKMQQDPVFTQHIVYFTKIVLLFSRIGLYSPVFLAFFSRLSPVFLAFPIAFLIPTCWYLKRE